MSETMTQDAEVRALRIPESGVIMTFVTSGSDLTERAVSSGFEIAKIVRGELFRTVGVGIDSVEAVQQSAFKIVRELVARAAAVSEEAVDGLEAITLTLVRALRGSAEAMGEAVTRTTESLAGTRRATQAA